MDIVKEFIERNNLGMMLYTFLTNNDYEKLEEYIGIRFTDKFKRFVNNLAIVSEHDRYSSKSWSILCESIEPADVSLFGMEENRSSCAIGFPILELKDMNKYKEYTSMLKVETEMNENLYPIFDEFEDGHSLICISSDGKVYNYVYELDDDGYGSLLANSMDEFVDKLILEN